jgi:hypothetical protein
MKLKCMGIHSQQIIKVPGLIKLGLGGEEKTLKLNKFK